jgi:hypothetical protein
MRTSHGTYFNQLYRAVLEGVKADQAPLGFTERIHEAIQPYLRDEYQTPQPPLHEV